jgi:hypothetical protein
MRRIALILAFAAGLGLLGISYELGHQAAAKRAAAAASVLTPIGHEAAPPGGLVSNGWAIPNDPLPFATAYKNLATYLGPAIGPNNGETQSFYFGQLLAVPTNGPDHEIELQDLGRAHALLRGLTLTPDASPDPMAERLVLDAVQTGYDPAQLFGRFITPVLHDQDTDTYEQYTDKALIVWQKGDRTAHREPLGCRMDQQCSRLLDPPVSHESGVSRMLPLLAGALLLLLSLGMLLYIRLRETGFLGDGVFSGV